MIRVKEACVQIEIAQFVLFCAILRNIILVSIFKLEPIIVELLLCFDSRRNTRFSGFLTS